jgi:hypothetical protein
MAGVALGERSAPQKVFRSQFSRFLIWVGVGPPYAGGSGVGPSRHSDTTRVRREVLDSL